MTGFLVRPLEWVAFGPPRPSSAGETHHRPTELPSPTTFQGIVRTALLAATGDSFSDRSKSAQDRRDRLVGGARRLPEDWQLRGPFLTEVVAREHGLVARPWLPAPRFLWGTRAAPRMAKLLRSAAATEEEPQALNDQSPSSEPLLLGCPEVMAGLARSKDKPLQGWLSPRGLRSALEGKLDTTHWDPGDHAGSLPPFVKKDCVVGLAIDRETGVAQDRMLYFGEVLRFAERAGWAGWLDGRFPSEIPGDALTRGDLTGCGWKGRPAALEPLPRLDTDFEHVRSGNHLPAEIKEIQSFFLVAISPALVGSDARAEIVERLIMQHGRWPKDVEVCVVAASIGVPRVIGGLEAASRRPRENKHFLEAGSTWLLLLRGSGASRTQAIRALNDAVVLAPEEEASFGYGHTLVGVGPELSADLVTAAWRRKEGRT